MQSTLIPKAPAAAAVFPRRVVGAPPYVLGVLPGEGIGPEVIASALRVLQAVEPEARFDLRMAMATAAGSGGEGLTPDEEDFFAGTFAAGGAVLCGPRGGRFVYELRRRFDLYLKLSPLRVSPALSALSPLRQAVVAGADVLIVRDNAGGVYQGEWGETRHGGERIATHSFSARESDARRILEAAAALAAERRGRMAVIGKEGGIPTITRLWREVAEEAARSRGIAWELINVDFAAYRLIQDPRSFDVLVCPNLEGDVLADIGAVLLGSRGASFSGNFTPSGLAVYQTNHGAAADLAGRDVANPLGQIFSLAMMLRESFGLPGAAEAIEGAVEAALARGFRTADLMGEGRAVGTREMTGRVIEELARRTAPA
jgi:3-isopropylmalate dehydrogenase